MNRTKRKMTKTVAMHYVKLVFRSILFLAATSVYVYNKLHNTGNLFGGFEEKSFLIGFIWVFFAVEMVLRFFPAKIESMGCQKQFEKNYIEKHHTKEDTKIQPWIVTFALVCAWIALNAVFGILYFAHLIDAGVLILLSLFYSVCDVVCILFFCPFQTWFMKNKCCATCRIYNWDYAMMCTPLVFVKNVYTWSLLFLALILLIKWEYLLKKHPERFSEKCNDSLSCAKCREKLCHHKTQLQHFLKNGRFNLKGNSFFKK